MANVLITNIITNIKEEKLFSSLITISFVGMSLSIIGLIFHFIDGLEATNETNEVPFGLWVALYIFFTGLSAGSFIVSTLAYVFKLKRFRPIGRRAVVLAILLLLNAPIYLFLSLGRPERFMNLYLYSNNSSWMSIGAKLLLIYPIVLLVYLWALIRVDIVHMARDKTGPLGTFYRILSLGATEIDEEGAEKAEKLAYWLGIVGIPTALITHGYTGFLFSVIPAHPLWSTPIMSILFITSAMVSGTALLAIFVMLSDWWTKSEETVKTSDYSNLILTFLFLDFAVLMSELISVYFGNVEGEVEAWEVLWSGNLAFLFWGVELVIGVLIPAIIYLLPQTKNSRIPVFIACNLVVIGVFAKRINLIIGGQLTTSFTHETVRYSPSINEILIGMGGIASVAFFFMIFWYVLPLDPEPIIDEEKPAKDIEKVKAKPKAKTKAKAKAKKKTTKSKENPSDEEPAK